MPVLQSAPYSHLFLVWPTGRFLFDYDSWVLSNLGNGDINHASLCEGKPIVYQLKKGEPFPKNCLLTVKPTLGAGTEWGPATIIL